MMAIMKSALALLLCISATYGFKFNRDLELDSTPISVKNASIAELKNSTKWQYLKGLFEEIDLNAVKVDPDELVYYMYEGDSLVTYNRRQLLAKLNSTVFDKIAFVTHGFTDGIGKNEDLKSLMRAMKTAMPLFPGGANTTTNVIGLDWSKYSKAHLWQYVAARYAVEPVGKAFYKTLVQINAKYRFGAGHSLGAHVMGFIGKSGNGTFLDRIMGMDAAGPLFSLSDTKARLCPTDGKQVSDLHTSWLLGWDRAITTQDIYANDIMEDQPGCSGIANQACNHGKSIIFMTRAFTVGVNATLFKRSDVALCENMDIANYGCKSLSSDRRTILEMIFDDITVTPWKFSANYPSADSIFNY